MFLSMKGPRVFLLPVGWDANPLQANPPAFHQASLKNLLVLIYTPLWKEAL